MYRMEKYVVQPYSWEQNEIHMVTEWGSISPIISDQEKPRLTSVPRSRPNQILFLHYQ